MYVCMYLWMYVCVYVCMYACMSVYVHACIYIYIYIFIFIYTYMIFFEKFEGLSEIRVYVDILDYLFWIGQQLCQKRWNSPVSRHPSVKHVHSHLPSSTGSAITTVNSQRHHPKKKRKNTENETSQCAVQSGLNVLLNC